MSIGLQNNDSSFFVIDTPVLDSVYEDDVISFSLTEEMNKINNGTLTLLDERDMYSRMLRVGSPLKIEWGYSRPDFSITSLFGHKENPLEMIGGFSRSGFKGTVSSPSGGGSSGGVKTYTAGFYGSEYLGVGNSKVYRAGTKGGVIYLVLADMGILDGEVKFTRMFEPIRPDTQVFQHESNFKFLQRMAYEWGAVFRIGYGKLGQMTAVFISPKFLDASLFPINSTSAVGGSSILLSYMDKPNNVIEFSWQNHAGDSGSGDNMRITMINGAPVIQRFITTTDSVIVWTLNMDKLKKEMSRKQVQGGVGAVFDFVKKWSATNDWEKIKRFFIRSKETTAPQGVGYSVNVKMIGNPLMTAPSRVVFGNGFPDAFGSMAVSFHVKKVTHTIDRKGYFMDLECADSYTVLSGALL